MTLLNLLIDKMIALLKAWKSPRELISLVSLLALVLVIFLMIAKAGRGDDDSALTDAYADREVIRSALEEVFARADGDLQATVGQLEARGFTCAPVRTRPEQDVWCSYRGTFKVEIGREFPPISFRREIGLSVDGGMLRASLGYSLTSPHAEDEEVRSELERLYGDHAESDVRKLVGLLEAEGYRCRPASSPEFETWCDFRAPIPFVFQDGMRFMFELRRQVLLAATDSGLTIRVVSHVTGL